MTIARTPAQAWRNLRSHARHPAFVMVLLGLLLPCLCARLSGASGAGLLFGPALAALFVAAAALSDGEDDDPQHPVPGWDPLPPTRREGSGRPPPAAVPA